MNKKVVHVGPRLRRLRKVARVTVRGLADKSGFTASFISQVERGLASPSISSLERIASGIGISLGQFFDAASDAGPAVTKATQRYALQSGWSRAKLEALGSVNESGALQGILITMSQHGSSGKKPHTSQWDQLAIIFNGEVLLTLDGTDHTLHRGDSVSIRAGVPHRWQNRSRKDTQIILVTARFG